MKYEEEKRGPAKNPAPIGQQFHDFIVIEELQPRKITKGWERQVRCHCTNCGNYKIVALRHILHGHYKSCGCRRTEKLQEYTSQVDGVKYLGAFSGKPNNKYARVMVRDGKPYRESFHVLEAEKVFAKLGAELPEKAVVHHINHNKLNNDLVNLSVFSENGKHTAHHQAMEKALYKFVAEHGLLDEFYQLNPELQLTCLAEMLQKGKTFVS